MVATIMDLRGPKIYWPTQNKDYRRRGFVNTCLELTKKGEKGWRLGVELVPTDSKVGA